MEFLSKTPERVMAYFAHAPVQYAAFRYWIIAVVVLAALLLTFSTTGMIGLLTITIAALSLRVNGNYKKSKIVERRGEH